jgi:hypothetical protein
VPVRGLFPYFFAVETLDLEFNRLTTLVNAVPGGEAMAEVKDADEARGNNMDGEAMAVEAISDARFGEAMALEMDSDALLGAAMTEEKDLYASLGDITDERARFRLRRKSTGGRGTGIAAITQNWTKQPNRRIRKKRANTGCIGRPGVVADPAYRRHSWSD